MGEQEVAGFYGGVAQLGEHLPCKQGVMSSNLTISIQFIKSDELYLYLENRILRNFLIQDIFTIKRHRKSKTIIFDLKNSFTCNAI